MALPLWGSLEKSTDNSQTIDEAISAAIDAHDADASAHLGSGASLAAHKAFEVIDHPAGSVVGDKLARQYQLSTTFSDSTGLALYGHGSQQFGSYYLYTLATTSNLSVLSGGPNGFEPVDWTKAMYLRFVLNFYDTTNMLVYFGAGCDDLGDGYSGYGFKYEDGNLYAYHAEDTGSGAVFTTAAITGYDLSETHTFEVVYDPTAGTLTFFIDGNQEAQFTSGLPTTNDDTAFMVELKTKENVAKHINLFNYFLAVDY